jgi:transposase-like protein
VPKSAQSFVATMVRSIFAQPDAQTVHGQHRRIVEQLATRFPEAAALLDEIAPDLLAFTAWDRPTICVGMDRKEIHVIDNPKQVGRVHGFFRGRRGAERARRASEARRWRRAPGWEARAR